MKRSILISCSCLFGSILLLWASDPGIGDWPMWGGTPDRNMVSKMKGLPTSWDVKSGKEVRQLAGHTDWVNTLAFSPDGKTLVSGSDDKTVRCWDPDTGQEKQQLRSGAGDRAVANYAAHHHAMRHGGNEVSVIFGLAQAFDLDAQPGAREFAVFDQLVDARRIRE